MVPHVTLLSVCEASYSASFATLNNDRFDDIVVACRDPSQGKIAAYLALPGGSFSALVLGGAISGSNTLVRLAAFADLNGDGFTDAIVHTNDAPPWQICVLTASPAGTGVLTPLVYIPMAPPGGYLRPRIVDINADGRNDIIYNLAAGFGYILQSAPGTAAVWGSPVVIDTAASAGTMTAADFNGDNRTDVIRCAVPAGTMYLYLGQASAPWLGSQIVLTTPLASRLSALSHGDMDEDGDVDLVVGVTMDPNMLSWIENIGGVNPFAQSSSWLNAISRAAPSYGTPVSTDDVVVHQNPITGYKGVMVGYTGLVSAVGNYDGVTWGGFFEYACVGCASMSCFVAANYQRAVADVQVLRLPPGTYGGCLSAPFSVVDQRLAIIPAIPGTTVILNGTGCANSLFAVATATFRTYLSIQGITFVGFSSPVVSAIGVGTTVNISDCVFLNSTAVAGSAIHASDGARVFVRSSKFFGLRATTNGGAIAIVGDGTQLTVTASTFASCTAAGAGGAIFAQGQGQSSLNVSLTNCSLIANSAKIGGAIAAFASTVPTPGSGVFEVAGLAPQQRYSVGSHVRLQASLLASNRAVYGGVAGVCGLQTRLASIELDAARPNTALMGDGVFTCVDNTHVIGSSSPLTTGFVSVDAAGMAALPVAKWATPPLAMNWFQAVPAAVVPGLVIGSGAVVVVDGFDNQYPGGTLTLALGVRGGTVLVGSLAVQSYVPAGPVLGLADIVLNPLSVETVGTAATLVVGVASAGAVLQSFDIDTAVNGPAVAASVLISPCPEGFGRGTASPFTCRRCMSGLFSLGNTVSECELVPECHSNSARDSDSLNTTTELVPCLCIPGAYTRERLPDTPCLACPVGSVCPGGLARPYAKKGFFDASGGEGSSIVACQRPLACRGGPWGTQVCEPGYSGYFCNTCESGYFSDDKGNVCAKCRDNAKLFFWLFVLFVLVLGIAMSISSMLIMRSLNKASVDLGEAPEDGSADGSAAHRKQTPSVAMMARLRLPALPYSVRAGIVYAQTIGLMATLDVRWPTTVRRTMEFCSVFNLSLEIFAVACTVGTNFSSKYIAYMLLPFAVSFIVVTLAGITSAIAGGREAFKVLLLRLFSVVAPIAFLPLSVASLQLFDCTRYPDGKYYLDADLGMQCFSDKWRALLPIGLASVALYVIGIPLTMFIILHSYRRRLASAHALVSIGSLYRFYRSSYAYFELFHLAKRLVFVITLLFLSNWHAWQTAVFQMLFLSFAFLHVHKAPMYVPFLNTLESTLHACLAVIALLAALFRSDDLGSRTSRLLFIGMAVAVVVFGLVFTLCTAVSESVLRSKVLKSPTDALRDIRLGIFLQYFRHDAADWLQAETRATVSEALGIELDGLGSGSASRSRSRSRSPSGSRSRSGSVVLATGTAEATAEPSLASLPASASVVTR